MITETCLFSVVSFMHKAHILKANTSLYFIERQKHSRWIFLDFTQVYFPDKLCLSETTIVGCNCYVIVAHLCSVQVLFGLCYRLFCDSFNLLAFSTFSVKYSFIRDKILLCFFVIYSRLRIWYYWISWEEAGHNI